jgi:hypothetical protein
MTGPDESTHRGLDAWSIRAIRGHVNLDVDQQLQAIPNFQGRPDIPSTGGHFAVNGILVWRDFILDKNQGSFCIAGIDLERGYPFGSCGSTCHAG